MLRSIWRGALGVVVWGAMACAAPAQTNVPQTPSNYKSPSGAYVLGGAVNLFGIDSVSGAECLIGLTPTCQLSIGSGSSIIGKVGIDQTSPGTTNGVVVNSLSYPLLVNTSATGSSFTANGGNYQNSLSGTFGAATVSINETINGVVTTLGTYAAAPSVAPCFAIPAGASVQAVVTGGSPSGLYDTLGGVGSCPSAQASQLPSGIGPQSVPGSLSVTPASTAADSNGRPLLSNNLISTITGWTVPLSGFSNPEYLSPISTSDTTGFSVDGYQSIGVDYQVGSGTATVAASWTEDPAGAVGWTSAQAYQTANPNTVFPSCSAAAGVKCTIFIPAGIKRVRLAVTALSTANLTAVVYGGAGSPSLPATYITGVNSSASSAWIFSETPFPGGTGTSTSFSASSGNVAAGVATATGSTASGKTTYLTSYTVTGSGATAASVITCTITGLLGGTQSFTIAVPAGVTTGITPIHQEYRFPLQASAANTAITTSCPSFGSGNTNATVSETGFYF